MTTTPKRRLLQLVAMMAVFAVVVAACGGSSDETTTTAGGSDETTTTAGTTTPEETTTTEGEEPDAGPATFDTYTLGMLADTGSDNVWAYLGDGAVGTVYTQYALAGTAPALFGVDLPSITVVPDMAAGEPAEPVESADGWTVTQPMRQDATWSDGEPITAHDVQFTFETVRDLGLGSDWVAGWPYQETQIPHLTSVTAVDDYTVELVFSHRPGLATWPHDVGAGGYIMPAHFWGEHVEAATAAADPVAHLFGVSGLNAPSAGPTVLTGWEQGAFIQKSANPNYRNTGSSVQSYDSGGATVDGENFGDTSGAVLADYTVGPFFDTQILSVYGDPNTAATALIEGEIGYWIHSLGVPAGLREQLYNADGINAIINPSNGMRYLGFNTEADIAGIKEVRQALALMIDREYLTQTVLQGEAFPMYAMVPEANVAWYNTEFGAEQKAKYMAPVGDRLANAVELLKSAGFTWDTEPSVSGDTVTAGTGLALNGTPVEPLRLVGVTQAYDALRYQGALWVETWGEQLGFQIDFEPLEFATLLETVYGIPAEFDMFVLGWSLGNPAFPTFHHSFWHSSTSLNNDPNGNNSVYFENEEFDAAAEAIMAATTIEEAYDAMWAAEAILAEELPYVVLFDTPIVEAYDETLQFPFTQTIGGLQFSLGFPDLVHK